MVLRHDVFLPAEVTGRWFYLYLILDLYSRKIVGYTVQDTDDADHAAHLARRTALAEGIHGLTEKPVLHGDNGATLKATTGVCQHICRTEQLRQPPIPARVGRVPD